MKRPETASTLQPHRVDGTVGELPDERVQRTRLGRRLADVPSWAWLLAGWIALPMAILAIALFL